MSRLKKNEAITRIMTKELQTINKTTNLSEVGKIFSESKFHHLPVVSGSKLIGIVGRASFEKRGRVNVGVGYAISINQAKNIADHTPSRFLVTVFNPQNPVVVQVLPGSLCPFEN